MKDSSYLLVRVQVPSGAAETAGALLLLLGATGIEERDETTLVAKDEQAIPPGYTELRAWLDLQESHEAIQARLLAKLGDEATVTIEEVDDRDWVEVVRSQIIPVDVGKRLRIRATWHPQDPTNDRIEIVLDPGLAFGTGTHPTTALCLRALEDTIERYREETGSGPSLLDLGCGSGILSIAALKLGATHAYAIDNDPIAIEVTRENAERAGVAKAIEATTRALCPEDPTFDLVAANIQLGVLLLLADDATAHLAPGGTIFLSGILEDQVSEARQAYEALGLEHTRTETEGGWACVHLRRPSPTTSKA